MGALTKDRGFWPKMVQDFFGAEDPFHMNNKFWFTDKSVEVPSANVIESEKEFKLELSAPGFDKKDFKIEVEEGILNISAEKEMKMEEERENSPTPASIGPLPFRKMSKMNKSMPSTKRGF